MTHPLLKSCMEGLAERYVVHKLFEAPDAEKFIAAHQTKIRAIAGGKVDAALMDALPKLEIISNFGVGVDSIDLEAAKARKIKVSNTANILNDAVAEMTLGLMIALARRIPQADRFVRNGDWPQQGQYSFQRELNGKTVGIVGLGRIGKEIAVRCQAMKMRVIYHGRRKQADQPFIYYDKIAEMARDADWLVIIAPGGAATAKLVSREVLEALGPEGLLVNMARGTLIDEKAMVQMLQTGALGGAALDVFEHEPEVPAALFGLDNVVLSPHQGSATHQTRGAMGAMVIGNLEAHFAGMPLLAQVV